MQMGPGSGSQGKGIQRECHNSVLETCVTEFHSITVYICDIKYIPHMCK